jgi:hypothetical protein
MPESGSLGFAEARLRTQAKRQGLTLKTGHGARGYVIVDGSDRPIAGGPTAEYSMSIREDRVAMLGRVAEPDTVDPVQNFWTGKRTGIPIGTPSPGMVWPRCRLCGATAIRNHVMLAILEPVCNE